MREESIRTTAEIARFINRDRFLSVTVKTNRKSCVNMRGCP